MTRIEIVGGGIAGLALAAALDPTRFEVTVHEQRADLPAVGTSLAVWPEARAALDEIGAYRSLHGVTGIDRFPILTTSGRQLVSLPVPEGLLVARGDLLRALDAAVPATVRRRTGRVATAPVDDPDAVVVGADGVHSVVRPLVDPTAAAPHLTGYLAVRGVVPRRIPDEHLGEHWGRGVLFGASQHPAGTNWYVSFGSDLGPRQVDVGQALDAARARLADATAPAVREVLDAADGATTLAQRIWTTAPQAFARGRTVLVGDAAHAMAPNLGRGACEALVDAVTLARLLGELPVEDALVAYDRARRRTVRQLQRRADTAMRVALASSTQPVRDALVGAVGRLVLAARPLVRA